MYGYDTVGRDGLGGVKLPFIFPSKDSQPEMG